MNTNSVLILQTMLNTIRNKDDILFMPYSFQSKRSRQFSCLKNNCSGCIWCSICTFVNLSFSMSSGSVVEQSNWQVSQCSFFMSRQQLARSGSPRILSFTVCYSTFKTVTSFKCNCPRVTQSRSLGLGPYKHLLRRRYMHTTFNCFFFLFCTH